MKQHFLLHPDITFLNFGSFGACNKPVFKRYQELQLECEAEPVQFIAGKASVYIQKGKEALGKFIGCEAQDLVLVSNPSYAVNLIAKNMKLETGDEILSTHVEYGACDKTWEYYCEKAGAKYIKQAITLPLTTADQFVNDLFKGVSAKTKLVFISHITSSTALIFPVKKVIERAKELGIKTFIDGAHVPGHISLNITELDCDYYTGACHKWMMTPKGCSFLFTKKQYQNELDPLVVSWGYKAMFPGPSQFADYHQFNGTRDLTPFCCIPEAIQFMEDHDWATKGEQCRNLIYSNVSRFEELLQTKALAPVTPEFIGQMLSFAIPTSQPETLKQILYTDYKIEIPIMRQGDKVYMRFSIQAFNTQEDLDTLYEALTNVLM